MSRRSTVLAPLVTISTLLILVFATPAHAAASAHTASTVDYVALGDSYSSGVGAPGQSGLCLRGSNGYPAQWARRNDPASFRNVACGGAVTSDVRLFQVPYLTTKTDLVSITIGGNDAGFAPAVISCTIGSDASCAAIVSTARTYITDTLPGALDGTYRAIRRHAPNAHVVVLGYPHLFDETTAACGIGGMSLAKRRVLNDGADDLAAIIRNRAQAAGFTFADVRGRFDGHGVCSASPWINGLTIIPPTDSFHPNAAGYTYGYLPALAAALN
jgi:lysophospholipase L1-like esterase